MFLDSGEADLTGWDWWPNACGRAFRNVEDLPSVVLPCVRDDSVFCRPKIRKDGVSLLGIVLGVQAPVTK